MRAIFVTELHDQFRIDQNRGHLWTKSRGIFKYNGSYRAEARQPKEVHHVTGTIKARAAELKTARTKVEVCCKAMPWRSVIGTMQTVNG